MVSLRSEIEFGGKTHTSFSNLADLHDLVFKCLLSGEFSSGTSDVRHSQGPGCG